MQIIQQYEFLSSNLNTWIRDVAPKTKCLLVCKRVQFYKTYAFKNAEIKKSVVTDVFNCTSHYDI
jgi:hypothetical protein